MSTYVDLKTLEQHLKSCSEMIGLEKAFKWEIFVNHSSPRLFSVNAHFDFEPSFGDEDPIKSFYKKFAEIEENLQTGMLVKNLNDQISKLKKEAENSAKEKLELEKFKTHYELEFNMKNGVKV